MSDKKQIAVIEGNVEVVKGNLPELFKEVNVLHAANCKAASDVKDNALRIGVVLHQIKESVGHGEFLPAMAKECPTITQQTCSNYMRIVRELATEQITNSIGNLKKLPPSERSGAAKKAVDEMSWLQLPFKVEDLAERTKGKQITTLYLDYGIVKPPKKDGGFRPDADAVHVWLEKHHPKLLGTAYADLAEKLQRAFKKQYRPKALPPEMIAEGMRARGAESFDRLSEEMHDKVAMHFDPKFREEYIQLLKDYIASMQKMAKGKPDSDK
ncbi:MAG: hypothetical protein JWR69_3046 [Pedosphaera sp.]|nr:hypothetical protein [Pedosphaera sp.]